MGDSGQVISSAAEVYDEFFLPALFGSWATDVRGWTLADRLDDKQHEILVSEAEKELRRFVTSDGSVRFEHPALIASEGKR